MGPEGILESRAILLGRLLYQTEEDCCGNRNVTEENQHGEDAGALVQTRPVNLILPAERLKHRADAMAEMQAKQSHAQRVKGRNEWIAETDDHHFVDVVPLQTDRAFDRL